jgi:hypothetical protein
MVNYFYKTDETFQRNITNTREPTKTLLKRGLKANFFLN